MSEDGLGTEKVVEMDWEQREKSGDGLGTERKN